ncbi:DUF6232 family protein [Nucisporomicrobium flavum]|jgi:Family of unknown function (DUF6232)|uniref:DUF6232 family protein n=1 Tax=Nucisporomicrobium flavum TaxID=2785915 RepID=UPI0018F4CA4F|nr:DUF6232 family protein [Nucisporomicrobium flavum]
MRLYYRGPDAMVTSEHFVHRTPSATKAFQVRDLRNVCITQADNSGLPVAYAAGAAVLLIAAAWSLGSVSLVYGVAFLGASGFAVAAVAMYRRGRPRAWVLEGVYRGEAVRLYEAFDGRVFNQVSRALRRAIEDARPPSSWDDSAAA